MKIFNFDTLAEVEAANKASGNHWFDRETKEFFGTRLETDLLVGGFFVSSEQPPSGPRLYSVRRVKNEKGHIATIGEFCGWKSKREASAAIRAMRVVEKEECPDCPWKNNDCTGLKDAYEKANL